MAADEHNPSRRAVLGAAVGLPLASSFPRKRESKTTAGQSRYSSAPKEGRTPDQARGDGEWTDALAAFRSAEAEVRAVERATSGYSAEEEEAVLAVYEDRLDVFSGALRGVMLAGAPDFAAFASKLELFFRYELEPDSAEEEVLAAIRGDARRLAGPA